MARAADELRDEQRDELREAARAAAAQAYVPASRFAVGAALRATDGRVFRGCNVEIASLGLTICAERNALFAAIAAGARGFDGLAVWTPVDPPGFPCGACRQALAEFADDLPIALDGPERGPVVTTLAELFPHPFRFAPRSG